VNPRDIERLAARIERLQRIPTHGWMTGDDLEFSNLLPSSRVSDPSRKLPTPETLLSQGINPRQYVDAVRLCQRADALVSRNRPNNPRRLMHDMARGRVPYLGR